MSIGRIMPCRDLSVASPPAAQAPPRPAEPSAEAFQVGNCPLLCGQRRLELSPLRFHPRAADLERDHLLLHRGYFGALRFAVGPRFGQRSVALDDGRVAFGNELLQLLRARRKLLEEDVALFDQAFALDNQPFQMPDVLVLLASGGIALAQQAIEAQYFAGVSFRA